MATSKGSWFRVPGSRFRFAADERGTLEPETLEPLLLCPERTAAAAGRLRVRVVEDESFADEIRVVVEHGPVQEEQALLVHKELGAFGPLEYLVAGPRDFFPRERIAQARAAAALHADAQAALVDALLGHQRADLARRRF